MSLPQIAFAQRLEAELKTAGHDEITAADVLDCLATAGLALTPSQTDEVAFAYLTLINGEQDAK
jgi:hypothetical protein